MTGVWHWLLHAAGVDSTTSEPYAFWSGFGGNAFILGLAILYNRFTCDVPGCYRIGLTRQELTGHSFCGHHDRLGKIEAETAREKARHGELPTEP